MELWKKMGRGKECQLGYNEPALACTCPLAFQMQKYSYWMHAAYLKERIECILRNSMTKREH